MDKKKLIANGMLLTTAIIWGTAFVAQRVGMESIEPFTFVFARYFLAGLCLLPVIWFMKGKKSPEEKERELAMGPDEKKRVQKGLLTGGLTCGTILFIATSLQQVGIQYTSAGKTAFITTLYIVLVPLGGLFLKKKVRPLTWFGVALATVGLYLLCVTEGFTSVDKGDFIIFIGAFFWAGHILACDHFSEKWDPVKLSCIQFFVVFIYSIVVAFIVETPTMAAIIECFFPIAYCGIFSAGIGYTFQMVAQKNTDPTVASLILSTEAVFGALAGFLLLNEVMSTSEFLGCILMFAAVILTQLPEKTSKLA